MGSVTGVFFIGGGFESFKKPDQVTSYFLLFIFYLINSTVIIFFNMALIHCTFKILSGKQATIGDGIEFSLSRLKLILSWALVSATIDIILKFIERKHAILTNIMVSLFGMLWSLATFLVIPVMAYENLGVSESIKRSASLFKNTWGERAGAGFSFGAIGFILFISIGLWLGYLIVPFNFIVFIVVLLFTGSIIFTIISAVETVFLATVYQYAAGIPVEGVNKTDFGGIFVAKI